MRSLKGWIVGALALAGVFTIQAEAQARPMTPPELVPVAATPVGAQTAAPDASCYRRYRHGWRGHRWHRRYGWRRPYGIYRPYGWRRPYYGHRGYGWRHGYGRHRW